MGSTGSLGTTPRLVDRVLFVGDAVLMAASGTEHTAAVTQYGTVYPGGRRDDCQLAPGVDEDQLAPRRLPAAGFNSQRVVTVAAGGGQDTGHTAALSEEGRVYTWGGGRDRQRGHDDREHQLVPRQVEPDRFVKYVPRRCEVAAVLGLLLGQASEPRRVRILQQATRH